MSRNVVGYINDQGGRPMPIYEGQSITQNQFNEIILTEGQDNKKLVLENGKLVIKNEDNSGADGIQTDNRMSSNDLPAAPRLRTELSNCQVVTNSWQTLVFGGSTSNLNTNTYPEVNDQGDRLVNWDQSNDKFKFENSEDQNYTFQMDFAFDSGLRPAEIDIRFKIPGTKPVYFPLSGQGGYTTLTELHRFDSQKVVFSYKIYASEIVRTEGLQVQVRVNPSDVIITNIMRPTLEQCNLVLTGGL